LHLARDVDGLHVARLEGDGCGVCVQGLLSHFGSLIGVIVRPSFSAGCGGGGVEDFVLLKLSSAAIPWSFYGVWESSGKPRLRSEYESKR
jgi:hypothetical protein